MTFKVRYKNKFEGHFVRSIVDGELGPSSKTTDWCWIHLPDMPTDMVGTKGATVAAFHEDWERVDK